MDIVSFETAKRLKEAGFPQPEHKSQGQVWYSGGHYAIYVAAGEFLRCGFVSKKGENFETLFDRRARMKIENEIFAPTATDILRLLPDNDFYFDGKHFAFSGDMEQGSDNPAEVAAAAWLSLSAKTSNDPAAKFGEWQPMQIMDMTKSKAL